MAIDIHLQPKQAKLLDLIESSPATVIGVGGGRGAAKSAGADRAALILAIEQPGVLISVVMRNSDQIRQFHFDQLKRDFPILSDYANISYQRYRIPVGEHTSEINCSYADNLENLKRRFRSGNIRYIFVDQAEQFTWEELSELNLAIRSKGKHKAKMILLFNMGGIGIQDLANRFGPDKKFNDNERPEDYTFLHVFPQDNVEWSRSELELDGLTEDDYYSWTDQERFDYFVTRSAYGRKLNALDDATRARDLLGSWKALEGAFFGRVYDFKKTMVSAEVAEKIIRPWDSRWLSTDWGKTHYCSTHWHGKSLMSPREIKETLGWDVPKPLNVVSTYRRMIVNEMTSVQVGKKLVEATPVREREQLQRYFFSPEQFGERDSENTVPINIGIELAPYGMPEPERADNSRKPGWELMAALLNSTRIWATPPADRTEEMLAEAGDTVWVISSECPELHDAIPYLMRNPKDLDDIVKTDLSQAVMRMDVADDVRYGLLSMLGSGHKPEKVRHAERLRETMERTHDPNAVIMQEISWRAQQNQRAFQVSGRVRR